MIRVGQRQPVRLVERAGPTVSQNGRTIVLLSHIPGLAESYERVPGEEDTFRVVPLFNRPGEVPVTLLSGDEELGTRTVTVVQAPGEATDAIETLFPVFSPRQGDKPPGLKWTEELAIGRLDVLSTAPIQELRNELEVVQRHPDWAEIAELLVARMETRAYYQRSTVSEVGRPTAIRTRIGDLPQPPEIVIRCLDAKLTNLFSQAIQDDIRGILRRLRVLDAQRRGEGAVEIEDNARQK